MSTSSERPSRSLPARPDLRHLRNQAKDLLAAGKADSLTDAQRQLAREYGFASWPRLKTHVESIHEVGQLKAAIDQNDAAAVQKLMTVNPELHCAQMGYGGNGPLTWAAECRGTDVTPERLQIIRWMLENGSDVHQGGDGPLMRAALRDSRIAIMELLLEFGADVNARWDNSYPIVFAPCETIQPRALKSLIDHGADFTVSDTEGIDCAAVLVGTYSRHPGAKGECLDILEKAGCQLPDTAPMAVHRGRIDLLAECLKREPDLIHKRFTEEEFFPYRLDYNLAGGLHGAPLTGGTLLQLAVEYQEVEIVSWLIQHAASANAQSECDEDGFGGVTPLFHTTVTIGPQTAQLAEMLLKAGADPAIRATFRRRLRPTAAPEKEEVFEYSDVTAIGFAEAFEDTRFVNEAAIAAIRQYAD